MKVYAVQHNSMFYDSSFETVSIHRTKQGAVKAMIKLKQNKIYGKWLGSKYYGRVDPFELFRYNVLELQE